MLVHGLVLIWVNWYWRVIKMECGLMAYALDNGAWPKNGDSFYMMDDSKKAVGVFNADEMLCLFCQMGLPVPDAIIEVW